jgi:hypothetical protein
MNDAVRIPEVTLTALLRLDRVSPKTVDALLAEGPDGVPPFRVVLKELEGHSRANTRKLGRRERSLAGMVSPRLHQVPSGA